MVKRDHLLQSSCIEMISTTSTERAHKLNIALFDLPASVVQQQAPNAVAQAIAWCKSPYGDSNAASRRRLSSPSSLHKRINTATATYSLFDRDTGEEIKIKDLQRPGVELQARIQERMKIDDISFVADLEQKSYLRDESSIVECFPGSKVVNTSCGGYLTAKRP